MLARSPRQRGAQAGSGSRLAPAALGLLLGPQGLEFRGALKNLIRADGEVLDHRVGHLETALKFLDRVSGALHVEENVKALALFADAVGKPAAAHLFDLLHLAAGGGNHALHLRDELLNLVVGHIGPDDKNHFVITHGTSRLGGRNPPIKAIHRLLYTFRKNHADGLSWPGRASPRPTPSLPGETA